LLSAPPVVVLDGQHEMTTAAAVPAGFAATPQAQDVNLVP
jgi:hypothetical protein